MHSQRVAVLMGGPSSEHDVSLKSGAQIATSLRARWPLVEVVIGRDGRWSLDGEACSLGGALDRLAESSDVVFPALHGPFGEDGTVQALLDTLMLPYVGSGVAASALAMDKARAKRIYQAAGLPTPAFAHLCPGEDGEARSAVEACFPCVVKPSASGSSFGVSFPKDVEEATSAIVEHLRFGREVVVERVVQGRELTCGILDFEVGPRALPVTEIIPSDGYAFFDYEAKYTPGATNEVTPAQIPDPLRDEIQFLALRAHRALGCRDLSRTDVMLDEGRPSLLETNTLPGFTQTSLLPQAAAAHGMSFDELVDHLLGRALSHIPRVEPG